MTNKFFLVLRNNIFKHAFIKFLVALREVHANANIIQDLQIYATIGD